MTIRLHVRRFALALSVLLTTISASWATDQTITLTLGTGSALLLERPFKAVLIGDPNVVDVVTRGDRSVIFEPLNPGATNVVFIDERSIAITNVRVFVCEVSATRIAYPDRPNCVVDKKEKPQG
jgi:Flp pilus assembly secretin CpaC